MDNMMDSFVDLGTYLDPSMIRDVDIAKSDIGIAGSEGGGIMRVGEVPLADGRIAIVDNNGIIVDFK